MWFVNFENNDIILDENEAIEIAKSKEKELYKNINRIINYFVDATTEEIIGGEFFEL